MAPLGDGSAIGRPVKPTRALRKYLAAGLGDPDRMLELGGERSVPCNGGPAVVENLHVGAADVDHRLDGEDHSGLELGAGAGTSSMHHLGAVVEQASDAVTAKVTNDTVPVRLGMALNRVCDIAQMIAGLRLLDAECQTFIGDVDKLARFQTHIANQVHPARVSVPAIEDRSDVDVDDVALLEWAIAGDSVADDMIDRDAAALGIAAIAKRRWHSAALERQPIDDLVERLGRNSGNDMRR